MKRLLGKIAMRFLMKATSIATKAIRGLVVISACLLLSPSLRSQATYSYTSPTFGDGVLHYIAPGSGLTNSNFVSASVTYNSVLAPNLNDFTSNSSLTPDLPLNWLFSDGVRQWTPANSQFYVAQVNTDAEGNITGWDFNLYSLPGFTLPQVYVISSTPSTYGSAEVNLSFTQPFATAYVFYGPGIDRSWTLNNSASTLTSLTPSSAVADGPAFTLTVNGMGFVSTSVVTFGTSALATTFVSATQLTAAILASDIATAGSFNVTVTNPGGGTSNAVSFTVVTPQQATQTITNFVNALFSQGVINGGQDNSLVVQLQHAINLMNAGKNNGAIGILDSFISEVNDLLNSGVLSPSQAASLISAAQNVIAALP